MNLLTYFANHGIRFYIGMSAEDFIKGMAAIPALCTKYPDAMIDINTITLAARYRRQMEEDYKQAQAEFEAAKDQLREYSATMAEHMDEFNNAVQTTGGFLADGISLAPSYTLPQTSVTEAFAKMEDGNDVPNFVNQITGVISMAKMKLSSAKRNLDDAIELEKDVIKTSIYKLTILHI